MYKNKTILAPMVKYIFFSHSRIGQLPFRLLALEYGADLVYTEEIIDRKLLDTKRIFNERLGTIEYVSSKHQVVYQTCKLETGKNVLHIGTASSTLALKTALHCYEDYAALDINMGCPVHFSIHG
jgi:tRNA-dihydrouridine synthase 2